LTRWGPLGTVDTFLLSVDRDYQYDSSVTFGEHREMWRGSFSGSQAQVLRYITPIDGIWAGAEDKKVEVSTAAGPSETKEAETGKSSGLPVSFINAICGKGSNYHVAA